MVVRSAGIVALRITACIKKTKKNQKEEWVAGSKSPKNIDSTNSITNNQSIFPT